MTHTNNFQGPLFHLLALLALLALATAGCTSSDRDTGSTTAQPDPATSDHASTSETEGTSGTGDPYDAAAVARDYSLGYCSVGLQAPAPCVEVRGKRASGIAPGCQHDNCTVAKQNARANLLTGIPAACGAYIGCGDPCRCIKKAEAEAMAAQEEH